MPLLILLFVLLTRSVSAHADTVLVQYGFDGTLPSAQEGFYIFEHSQGFVEPTSTVKFSGYRSLELQEASGDGAFVELQGVVTPITTGDVLFHFAFFVRNPEQGLNIAVAGPAHFYLQPDGIAFWLKTQEGTLFHNSDSMFRRLFTLHADTWYVVDVVLHVETGTYDLRIVTPHASEALVFLEQQPNAIKTAGSKLSKISFIGDLEDHDRVHYFVDDVELRVLSSPLRLGPPTPGPHVATTTHQSTTGLTTPPGNGLPREAIQSGSPSSQRRTYFDEYLELKQLEVSVPECLPATSLRDFGVSRDHLKESPMLRDEVRQAMDLPVDQFASPPTFTSARAVGIFLWRRGCRALRAGQNAEALADVTQGMAALPAAPIVQAAYALAANANGRLTEVERTILALASVWAEDARLPVLLGMLAASHGDFEAMRQALAGLASRLGEEHATHLVAHLLVGSHSEFSTLKAMFGERWKEELDDLYIGQSYYFSLLLSSRFGEAQTFAVKLITRYAEVSAVQRFWRERLADALVFAGKPGEARPIYEAILRDCPTCTSTQRRIEALPDIRG